MTSSGSTKQQRRPTANRLCGSCRRACKQPATVVIAACPRYYPRPSVRNYRWQQLELKF